MGFLSGALGQIGEQVRQKNLLDYAVEHEANQQMAKQFYDMAQNAEPELAPDFLKAGYAYATAKQGDAKKLNKQFNVQDLLLKHSQAKYAPQNLEQPPQAPPQVGHTPPVQLHPDMPELGTVDESMINAHNGVQDQIQQQIKQANDALAQQQVQAQAPPPVSGLPSPGFSSVMPAPPGGALPFPTLPGQPGGTTGFASDVNFQPIPELGGRSKQVLGDGMYSAVRTKAEQAKDAVAGEIAKFGAQYGIQNRAELERMTTKAAFDKILEQQVTTERIDQLKKLGIWDGLDANERANVIIDAKRIIPARSAANADTKEVGGVLFERPPNAPPGTPWLPVTPGSGTTAKLSEAQQTANAGYEATKKKIDPNYKIAPEDYPKAKAWFDEQAMTPEQLQQRQLAAENIRQLEALRRETMLNTQLHVQEFQATHGADAINNIVKQMKVDPDVFFAKDMDPGTRQQVAQAYTQATGNPPPRELPGPLKAKEGNSIIALNSVSRIKKMLADNPVILKRLGAWNGRAGNLEQAIGDTAGLSPQDAQTIQQFRSAVNYLFFQESQSILQRPAQQLMEELKATSPSMKQGLPLFLGSLEAVKGTAQGNIDSANDYRFNRVGGGMPAPPVAVNPFRQSK